MNVMNAFDDLERPYTRATLESKITLHPLIPSTMTYTQEGAGNSGTSTTSATSSSAYSITKVYAMGVCKAQPSFVSPSA